MADLDVDNAIAHLNGDSSDFTNGGSTIALTLDSAVLMKRSAGELYGLQCWHCRCEGCVRTMVALADFSNTAL